MSVVIGADPAPETYADEKEHRAMIARHSRSVGDAVRSVDERVDAMNTDINDLIKIIWVGSITQTANATYTSRAISGVAVTDIAFLSPRSTEAAEAVAGWDGTTNDNGGYVLAATYDGGVIIVHPSAGTPLPVYNVMVVRP